MNRMETKQLTDNEQWQEANHVHEDELIRGQWMAFNAYNGSMGYGPVYKYGITHACDLGESSMYNVTHVKRVLPPTDQPQKAS